MGVPSKLLDILPPKQIVCRYLVLHTIHPYYIGSTKKLLHSRKNSFPSWSIDPCTVVENLDSAFDSVVANCETLTCFYRVRK